MSLTSTNALISVQDGNGAVVNIANGAVAFVTPGAQITVALQSTTGVTGWNPKIIAPAFPSLHNLEFNWHQGMANIWQFTVPEPVAQGTSIYSSLQIVSVVTDGVQSIAQATAYVQTNGGVVPQLEHYADIVAIAALAAYTNVNGTITANANGIMASVDGVTPTVGMFLFLPPGIAAAATDVGLYYVTSIGTASAPFVLNRAPDMAQGATINRGTRIYVGQGTVMAGTTWVLTTATPVVIGTTTQAWFPREVIQSVTLVAGTVTIANVPIFSATKTIATAERTTANTSAATTGGYNTIGGKTVGNLGTATLAFQACVAAGTINNADVSTLAVSIRNPV